MTEGEKQFTKEEEARKLLNEVRKLMGARNPEAIAEGVRKADEAIVCAKAATNEPENERKRLLATTWLVRSEALRNLGKAEDRQAALDAYEEIFKILGDLQSPESPDRELLAMAWTNRAMILLQEPATDRLKDAVESFDKAIAQRKEMELDKNVPLQWSLIANWMNRGDALTRLGGEESLKEAVASYDEAINHIQALPESDHPAYLSRLAVAWLNRGRALEAQKEPLAVSRAAESFEKAISVVRESSSPEHSEHRRILAFALVNRGHALLIIDEGTPEQALSDAREALAIAGEFERKDVMAAQAGLWGRHLLCLALVQIHDPESKAVGFSVDWLSEATDAVDEGMELMRLWLQRGVDLTELVARLFRVGGHLYQVYQPHFLREYLQESLDPTISKGAPVHRFELHQIATEIVVRTLQQIDRHLPTEDQPDRRAKTIAIRDDLRLLQGRITELTSAMRSYS